MKNKVLVLMCALSMTVLAACGNSEIAESNLVKRQVMGNRF